MAVILSQGCDLVKIDRIRRLHQRFGDKGLRRIFLQAELEACGSPSAKSYYPRLAVRFAAKEALMKALGTGFGQGITWQGIEVCRLGGPPFYRFHGHVAHCVHQLAVTSHSLSLSHDGDYALASCSLILERPLCTLSSMTSSSLM